MDEELIEERQNYKKALLYGMLASIFGWVALETNILGIRMSKSALASYAEQSGIVVPLIIDFTLLGRQFLAIDGIGLFLFTSF